MAGNRICVFGDSISWGADDEERGGWVDRLKVYFKTTGKFNEVFNLGNPGRETARLIGYIGNEIKARMGLKYKERNMVIIQIGINDTTLVNNKKQRTTTVQFRKNIQKLIDISKKTVNNIVFVEMTPIEESKANPVAWDSGTYYKNKFIKEYNHIIKSICNKNKVYFIPVFDKISSNMFNDGVHLTSKGHEVIFKTVKDFLIKNKLIK